MICSKCRHCGLCEGDGTFSPQKNLLVNTEGSVRNKDIFNILSQEEKEEAKKYFPSDIGIAFDIGTTTIAAAAYTLKDGMLLAECGEENIQTEFGSEVISRISFAMSEDGFDALHRSILIQINAVAKKIVMQTESLFLSQKKQPPQLKRIVIAGNTVMESFVFGQKVNSFAAFPFTVENKFGITVKAEKLFNSRSSIPSDCEIYFAPAVSAFAGGDIMCAFIACMQKEQNVIIADIGTNCEMLLYKTEHKKLFCTSSSAGPAFEGQGISCGMRSAFGAIASVKKTETGFETTVIGKSADDKSVNIEGICGTGLISVIAQCLEAKIIDENGTICEENNFGNSEKIVLVKQNLLQKEIAVTQKDIRNLQLAKGAVKAGLEILLEENEKSNFSLYMAGGFGTALNVNDICRIKLIPESITKEKIKTAGNASLTGASLILLSEKRKQFAEETAVNAQYIDLAQKENFQQKFISALNF